jgi:hypothetical protein
MMKNKLLGIYLKLQIINYYNINTIKMDDLTNVNGKR